MIIHSIMHGSRANGPGLRSVIWTQGCTLNCPGCQNPLTHSSFNRDLGRIITPEDLAVQVVRDSAEGTCGVTISGGEPMQQPVSLYRFLSMLRAIKPNWTVGVFTGYTLTELTVGHYECNEFVGTLADPQQALANLWNHQIKEALSWAVVGRYDKNRPTLDVDYSLRPHLRMCSSLNQCLYLFRSHYTYDDFPTPSLEVSIGPDGYTQISGFPPLNNSKGEV